MISGVANSSADRLAQLAATHGTPLYVYDLDEVRRRLTQLEQAFGERFSISYAVKANPNRELLRRLAPRVGALDVSSYAEVERALEAGCPAGRITFSGPGKRPAEVRGAIASGVGALVLESVAEAELADRCACDGSLRQPVLIRINPATRPRSLGISFSGRPSQFGVDEEAIDEAVDRVQALPHLDLIGFHIYAGSNSLDPQAIAANFQAFAELFRRASERARLAPRQLVFGSGFGLPYGAADTALDVEAVAALAAPVIDGLKAEARFAAADCMLEMGRWLVGPAGWLLTSVLGEKQSRGVAFRICDAGYNNHAAACGMLGTVVRRNWRFANLTNPEGRVGTYTLVGPLCTSMDMLATAIELPEVRVGDVLAAENSGAYGLTASPTRFISHPEPAEVLIDQGEIVEATESAANHWRSLRPDRKAASPLRPAEPLAS